MIFACTGCGKCCTGSPGYVFVTPDEIEEMADELSITVEAFARLYIRIVDGRFSLKELLPHHDCVFYKDKKCTVYRSRPKQCRRYPFWPRHMESEASWENVKKECEGIEPTSRLPMLHEVPRCHL